MKKMKYMIFALAFLCLFLNTTFASYAQTSNMFLKLLRITNYYRSKYGLSGFPGIEATDNSDRVIYGQDDRLDLYQLTANQNTQRILAKSVCLLTDKDNIQIHQNKYKLGLHAYTESGFIPCENEKFRQQKIGGWCTGFLVAQDVIATAGHCINDDLEAEKTAFVFGFAMNDSRHINAIFNENQVYYGKKLLARSLTNDGEDYAIVQLTKKIDIPNVKPLKIRINGNANINDLIGVIGHPNGLPLKVSYGETTRILDSTPKLYRTNLDTYGGNSGSPVFNTSGLVEGILVRGFSDYVIDRNGQCFRSAVLGNGKGAEMVTKAVVFAPHIPKISD